MKNLLIKKYFQILFLIAACFIAAIFVLSCSKSNSKENLKKDSEKISIKNSKNFEVTITNKKNSKISNKIILIGIDGADKEEVDKLISEGKLPNLKRLIINGAYGKLHSIKPLLSPMIWTSIATGKTPLKHGVTDFLTIDKKTGEEIPVSSNLRKVKALWNIFTEENKSAEVIGWLVTWPAEKINGFVVSDHITYLDYNPHKKNINYEKNLTYPRNLIDEIKKYIISPQSISYSEFNNFVNITKKDFEEKLKDKNSTISNAVSILASTKTIENVSSYLYKKNKVDLLCIYFKGIDSFSHLFTKKYLENKDEKNPIEQFYVYQDKIIGNILKSADDSTTVIIVSDHGFKLNGPAPNRSSQIGRGSAVDWHRDNGIIIMSGNNIKMGKEITEANVLDIAPTILYLSNLPVAKDLDGKVLTDAINSSFQKSHSIKKIKSYEKQKKEKQNEPISSKIDSKVKKELESLGYLNTGTGNSYNNIGNLYMNQGKYKLAAKSFEKAVELEPKTAAFYDNLGSAYAALKIYDKAIAAHKKAISLEPNSAKAYNNLGKVYSDAGQYQAALQNFNKALSIDPNLAEAYNNIGELYYKQNKINEAEKFINTALEKNPNYPLAHYNLGVIFGEKGEPSKAINEFEKVLNIDPDFHLKSNVYNGIGVAYFNLKNYEKALNNFKEAEKINPNFPDIHMRLGIVYINLRRKEEGVKELKKELKLNPKNERLRNLIDQLEKNNKGNGN